MPDGISESKRISSHLFRLSCPKLVQGIDAIEKKGGVRRYNEVLAQRPDWIESFRRVNQNVSSIRRRLVTKEEENEQKARFGVEFVDVRHLQ